MSVHAISWVLRNSKERLGNRLVLIVLADHAHGDGTNAWPSVATIKEEACLSERNVRYALRALEQSGAIYRSGRHESGTYIYTIAGVQDLPEGQSAEAYVQSFAPKPSEPPLKDSPRGTQELVAHYVDHASLLGVVLPGQTKGATAQQIGKLVTEGIDPRWIRRASELLTEKGLNPASLPSLVVEAQREDHRQARNGLSAAQIRELPAEEAV